MRVFKALVLCLPLLAVSCLQASYRGGSLDQPIEDVVFSALVPGESQLQDCLDLLGAPHLVQEYRVHGMTMAWGWTDQVGWGVTVSYGIEEATPSASFNWDTSDRSISGIVLFFDRDMLLEVVRRGSLADILPSRRPPASIEDIEQG